jgi:HNH endonuclease
MPDKPWFGRRDPETVFSYSERQLAFLAELEKQDWPRSEASYSWREVLGLPNSAAPVDEPRSRVIPQDVKIEVAARDGGRCRQCGSNEELHFDHVIPWSKGGANTADNIQLLCGTCNRRKGAADIPATLPPSPYQQAWRSPAVHTEPSASNGPVRRRPGTSEQEWKPTTCPDCWMPLALHDGGRCPGGR